MIDVKNLHKYFGSLEVLKGIDCHIDKGECVCVIGPSGSGKSTFLRCLNLLETPTKGDIVIDDMHLTEKDFDVDAMRKRVGMVFQHFNLFPHLTILENVTLAPIRHKMMTEEQAKEKAMELLNRVGVGDKADNYPAQLSGGQKQRVAIARSLALSPEVMLFDEKNKVIVKTDVKRYKKGVDAVMDLKNGAIDAVVIDEKPAQEFVKNNAKKLKLVVDSAGAEFYCIAITKGNTAYKEEINKQIKAIKKDGTYDKLKAKYIDSAN